MNKISLTVLAVVCVLISIPASLGAGVQAHLWLNSVNDWSTSSETGYIVTVPDFTLFVSNEAKFDSSNTRGIASLPGATEGILPAQTITIGSTVISGASWTWGTPCATRTNGNQYCMPPSDTFPTYYAFFDLGPIPAESVINADVHITGSPPVRFDAWGFDSNGFIILRDPFSHNLTYVPEFPTIALPVAAIIGLVLFFQHRKKKED